jgi:hypothetical protein
MNLQEMLDKTQKDGYPIQDARAKVCQDIVLKAISESSLSRNVTIKGGVVMRSITGNVRRATRDMDIDFIRYSLSDESIDIFIKDIYDMYYYCDKLDRDKLEVCLASYIFSDKGMRENDMSDIVRRITRVFQNKSYRSKVDGSDKRWLDESIDEIFRKISDFLRSVE